MTELTDYEKKVLEEFKERMAEGDFLKYGYLQDFLLKAIRDAIKEYDIALIKNIDSCIESLFMKARKQALSEMGVKFPNGKEGN